MTKTKALQKLYTKLTGLPARNTLAKVLSDMADNYSGGGGGSSLFVVNCSIEGYDPGTGFDVSADKTFAEIKEAYMNGAIITARMSTEPTEITQFPLNIIDTEANGYAEFVALSFDISGNSITTMAVTKLRISSGSPQLIVYTHSFEASH